MNSAGIIDLVPAELRAQWVTDGTYPDKTVYALFCEHAATQPDTPAVLSPELTLSYAQLLDKVRRLANSLKRLGIVPGDTVAYQLSNSWRSCAIDLAVAALGGVVAPFPPGRGRLDIEALLRNSGARAIIIEPEFGGIDFCEMVESIRPKALSLRFLIANGDRRNNWLSLDEMFADSPVHDDELPEVCPDSPVRMLVSSGTESEPKLVAYSHNALIGGRGRFLQRIHNDGKTFRGMYLIPLGSSFGSTATFGILCWLGGSVVVLPKFDPDAVLQAIERFRPSYVLGVPTMFQRMLAAESLTGCDLSSLQAIISGGSLIDKTTIDRCMQAFGCGFISLYGSADGVNCHNLLNEGLDVVSYSVGRPNPGVCDIRIVDDLHKDVPQGSIGEIAARGPLSPMQYVNAEQLDARYRDSQGWVYTGDLGFIDTRGYLVLAGRKKDIIIRGGTNISPVQIENLATSHPDVVSAACVPVADPDLGHRICICLSLKPGAERLSLAQITGYLTDRGLEVNKLPEFLSYFSQMPLSPAGKLDKKQMTGELGWLAPDVPCNSETETNALAGGAA